MAKPLELAEKYMESFFGRAPLEMMADLFSDDLVFEGPFQRFFSARQYMDSLLDDPPKDVHYILEKSYEDENSACMIYRFSKPGVETRMAQIFEIADQKICRMTLVFDSRAFT